MRATTIETPTISDLASRIAALAEVNVAHDNWVGAIQNAAIECKASPPEYRIWQHVAAPQHCPMFVCACELSSVQSSATGPSKKAAKREAAKAWVEKCGA